MRLFNFICFAIYFAFFQESRNYVEETLARIKDAQDPCQPAGQADLIIEAIVENMAVKKELFEKLDRVAAK